MKTEDRAENLIRPLVTAREIARAAFAAPVPEEYVRALSPQTLYMALQAAGPDAAIDLIDCATEEQYQVILDFELWEKDRFREDAFWSWLALVDSPDSFDALLKCIRCLDRRLIALMLLRHVRVAVMEEPTESPPFATGYTPDRGNTWLSIDVEDKERQRLIGRLLGLIFETDVELFYQLVSVPMATTALELEEEAYQTKCRRLLDQGIPSHESGYRMNTPLDIGEARRLLSGGIRGEVVDPGNRILPLVYERGRIDPLFKLVREIEERGSPELLQRFESEFTHIANCSLVYYGVSFHDFEQVVSLLEKVAGTVNIGLEKASEPPSVNLVDCFEILGLDRLYRLGLAEVFAIRKLARSISLEAAEVAETDLAASRILAASQEVFPVIPRFFRADGTFVETAGRLEAGEKAFEHLEEIRAVGDYLKSRFGQMTTL